MATIQCEKKFIQSFFMETKVKEPIYIGGVPTYDLYLEKYPHKDYLYVNGVRAKALSGGAYYQINEPKLFEYFDEICELFNDDVYIVIDDVSYLPLSIQVNGKYVLMIERVGTTFTMNTELASHSGRCRGRCNSGGSAALRDEEVVIYFGPVLLKLGPGLA